MYDWDNIRLMNDGFEKSNIAMGWSRDIEFLIWIKRAWPGVPSQRSVMAGARPVPGTGCNASANRQAAYLRNGGRNHSGIITQARFCPLAYPPNCGIMTGPYRDKDIGLLGKPLENRVVDQVTSLSFGLLGT
jgi:hypothetical protein